jgi:5S rRNA maturation endonuclease (ribonuclease M5)
MAELATDWRPLSEQELLGRFENVKRKNSGWEVQCPAHPDQVNSLCIHNRDGVWLLKCQAGCATEDVVTAVKLRMSDLFPTKPNGGTPDGAIYPYVDEQERVLFQVVRREGKRFQQRQPDPDRPGEWIWNMQGVRRVLYRLPRVLTAVEAGEKIYLAEGERDVHALERAGVAATCNPGGAGKWRAEYAETLRGANVIVIADKDEPGRKHAEAVRASLAAVTNSVRVAEAKRGKDAADHLTAGLSVDEFVITSGQERRSLNILSQDEFLSMTFEAESAFIEGMVPCHSLGTIAALPDAGKSFLAQDIATRVACGDGTVLGKQVLAQGRVLYVFEDDSTKDQWDRVHLFAGKHPAVGKPLYWCVNEGVQLPRDTELLREYIEELKVDLLVLDSFYNVTPGLNLRDNEAEQVVIQLKQEVVKPTGCTVLIVDHMPHPTEANTGRLRAYGGVFKGAAIRFGIYLDSSRPQYKLEIRGNNFPKTPKTNVHFNPDTLLFALGTNPASSDSDEWKPTILMERASRYVEACEEPPSKNQVEKAIHGKSSDHKRQAVDILIRDGYFAVEPGPRNAKLLRSVRPYRELDEQTSPPTTPTEDDIPF